MSLPSFLISTTNVRYIMYVGVFQVSFTSMSQFCFMSGTVNQPLEQIMAVEKNPYRLDLVANTMEEKPKKKKP